MRNLDFYSELCLINIYICDYANCIYTINNIFTILIVPLYLYYL